MSNVIEFPVKRFFPAAVKVQHITDDGTLEEFLFRDDTRAVDFLKDKGWRCGTARIVAFSAKMMLAVATMACLTLLAPPAEALDKDLSAFKKWNRVVAAEKITPAGEVYEKNVQLLQRVLNRYSGVRYVADAKNYGQDDYWATRAEMRARKGGDCEDFAISYYFDLIEVGFKDDDLRIAVVVKKYTQQLHAVLTVRIGSRLWVLDSEAKAVADVDYMDRFIVAYRINRNGWER